MPVSVTLPTIGDDGATYNNKIGGSLTALAAASDTNETNILTKVSKDTIVYNVKEHGAVGDGVTDDAPAINALITLICNGASSVNAKIFFPAGSYAVGSPIDLPFYSDKMRLIIMCGAGRSATYIQAIGSTSAPFDAIIRHQYPRDSVTTISSVSAGAAHHIHDMRLDCNKRTKFGVLLINAHACNLHNLLIKNACSQAVAGEPTAEIKITGQGTDYLSWEHHIGPNIRIEGGGSGDAVSDWATYGLWVNSSDNVIDDVISLRHEGADICGSSGNNFFSNCHTYYSDWGYYLKGLEGSSWVNCEADGPLVAGFHIESNKSIMEANRVFWPGAPPASVRGFDIAWNLTDTIITGNSVVGLTYQYAFVGADKLGAGCIVTDNVGFGHDTARLVTVKAVSTTTYTLVRGDNFVDLECSNGAAVTVTVPTEATVYFMVGTKIPIVQVGAGQVTVVGAGGVTVNSNGAATTAAQWAKRTLRKRSTNSWILD